MSSPDAMAEVPAEVEQDQDHIVAMEESIEQNQEEGEMISEEEPEEGDGRGHPARYVMDIGASTTSDGAAENAETLSVETAAMTESGSENGDFAESTRTIIETPLPKPEQDEKPEGEIQKNDSPEASPTHQIEENKGMLKAATIKAVERKVETPSTSAGPSYLNKRASLRKVTEQKEDTSKQQPQASSLPGEFAQTKQRLSKVDIRQVENKYMNKEGSEADKTQNKMMATVSLKKVERNSFKQQDAAASTAYTMTGLKKVDLTSVEHKTKPAPTQLPREMFARSQSLRKVDIDKVEQNKTFAPTLPSQTQSIPSVTLKKVNVVEQKEKFAPTEIPKEVESKRISLKKVDISQVEKTKTFAPATPSQTEASVTLKKVDIQSVEQKELFAPSEIPKEVASKRMSLKTVDISQVEKTRTFAPSVESQNLPAVALKKVDIQSVEQKETFAPTEIPKEVSSKRISLKKVDISQVENTKTFAPSATSDQPGLSSVTLKKVDVSAIESIKSKSSAPSALPEEVTKRSSALRKVDIETVEKTKHFEASSPALPSVALKKVNRAAAVERKTPMEVPKEVTSRRASLRKVDIHTVEMTKHFEPTSPVSAMPVVALKKVDLDAVENNKIKVPSMEVPKEVISRRASLRKVDIDTVELTKHFEPTSPISAMPAVALKKVDLDAVENNKIKVPSMEVPKEVTSRRASLRKVDIDTVEMTKHFEPTSPTSAMPAVALKNVDLDAVENKFKMPHMDVPNEVKRRSSTLRKVEITKSFEPSSVQSAMPSVALKKVDRSTMEKVKPPPTEVPEEVKRRGSTLRKVDIETVEKTKNFEPSPAQSAMPSVVLKKVDLGAVEHKTKSTPAALPEEVTQRSSTLRKVDIAQVEKGGYKGPETKLPTIALKKVQDRMSDFVAQ
ncbi:MAG: hypothetical protein SGBAC_008752 [Bacillariaceae sp.]